MTEQTRSDERRCNKCGSKYSTTEDLEYSGHYFGPPYNYGEGCGRFCLACWLCVGALDEFEDGRASLLDTLLTSVGESLSLLDLAIDNSRYQHAQMKMVLVSLVTALETYLGDILKMCVRKHKRDMDALICNVPKLAEQTVRIDELTKDPIIHHTKAHEYISGVLFHNLSRVNRLYEAVFGFKLDFGDDTNRALLFKAVEVRHGCVHRNGKDKDGNQISLSFSLVRDTAAAIRLFATNIDRDLLTRLSESTDLSTPSPSKT